MLTTEKGAIKKQFDEIIPLLRHSDGRLWRYRRPWLLLTGDAGIVGHLLPELAERGYLLTADAVLLWPAQGNDGQPDGAWLKQLYAIRRRRPVDGICLVRNGNEDLAAPALGIGGPVLQLERVAQVLRWSAPVYVLDVASAGMAQDAAATVNGCEIAAGHDANKIGAALQSLRHRLVGIGVVRLTGQAGDKLAETAGNDTLARLSQRLDGRAAPLAKWLASLSRQRLRGVFFTALPDPRNKTRLALAADPAVTSASADFSSAPLWSHLARLARRDGGRRTHGHPATVGAAMAVAAIGLWIAGMLLAAAVNQRDVLALQQVVQRAERSPDMRDRLRGLLALQQEIARYEHRVTQHAPWYTRFGLNRDAPVLQALWRPYQRASQAMLVAPVQQTLETELIDLAQVRSDQIDAQASRFAAGGHQALKAYLMLAEPPRSEAAFLAPQLARRWRLDARLGGGEQHDLGERLFAFYAAHLRGHPEWLITPSDNLVAAARATLLAAIGVERADTTLYRNILAGAADKYPDQNLPLLTLGTDPRGLLRSNAVVSGVFTRQAYEGAIAPAIAEAGRRTVMASDWVLAGTAGQPGQQGQGDSVGHSPQALEQALTERYFDDYAQQWQLFMNSLQWEAAPTMPGAIEQLKLMADARQSPVIALMKSLHYQANAGLRQASLSDTLVAKAQNLIGSKKTVPDPLKPDPAGPLGDAFGPVLRLVGNIDGAGDAAGNKIQANGELSLQRYLDRVSALRLRLQHINGSPDGEAQARQLALSLFQGKGSELADTQAYAQLVAASLGEQWAGMGDALFVRPVAQATQTLLLPAQASLNEAWSNGVASAWQKAFSGRYPFAQTDNDASLPELARFLRSQGGVIPGFLQSQLAGVLELQGEHWVPAAGSKFNFDPAFLAAINTLQRVGARLLVQGEPQYRFELKAVAQAPLREVELQVDGQKLANTNERENWKSMVWPAPQHQQAATRLQWQTEQAGMNKSYEFHGRWALIRMLERAGIDPLDSATFQLTWQASPHTEATQAGAATPAPAAAAAGTDHDHLMPRAARAQAPADLVHPLSYLMRTESGRGPLEILALRDFSLPTRIFLGAARGAAPNINPK